MNKIKFQHWIGLGFICLFALNIAFVFIGLLFKYYWFLMGGILLSVIQLALHDQFMRKHTVLQHYPYASKIKDILQPFQPLLSKFIFSKRKPTNYLNSEQKEIINKRAHNINAGVIQNSINEQYNSSYECVMAGGSAVKVKDRELYIEIGSGNCKHPYKLSLLNVGSLNRTCPQQGLARALSVGAKISDCAINTGVLGIDPFLLRGGGDLIWRISRFDDFCRDKDGAFNEKHFEITAKRPYVKMIEIKISLEDLPLTGKQLTFHNMIYFLERLKVLSGGKPIGISLFTPSKSIINCICKTMYATGIYLDFITIENTNTIKSLHPYAFNKTSVSDFCKSIAVTRRVIDNYKLPTKIIASGDMVTEYDILKAIALGANACYSIQPFETALGSNTRLKNSVNELPSIAVANYHRNTLEATLELMAACSYQHLSDVKASDFYQTTPLDLKTLEELYSDESQSQPKAVFTSLN